MKLEASFIVRIEPQAFIGIAPFFVTAGDLDSDDGLVRMDFAHGAFLAGPVEPYSIADF